MNSPAVFTTRPLRVFVLGATGTIGCATVRALVQRGHEVVSFIRPSTALQTASDPQPTANRHEGSIRRFGHVTDPKSLSSEGFRGERFDVLVSCLASRNGVPKDAWAIDYQANMNALSAARIAGINHFVLVSAICVQKPQLAFQHAKLAFEKVLIDSGLTYSIVRPTAFFKSLSGQVERVKSGKPFLLFGDGRLTSCKPISDGDLAQFIVDCLEDGASRNSVLPIGGPGEAITPRQQGDRLFALLNQRPQFRQVPIALLDGIIGVLGGLGRVVPALAVKAELARIGRYYATESMLVLDPDTGRYDAQRTPSTGSETLFDFYAKLVSGAVPPERGAHAVF